jgi:hypothetical protein
VIRVLDLLLIGVLSVGVVAKWESRVWVFDWGRILGLLYGKNKWIYGGARWCLGLTGGPTKYFPGI